MIEVTKLDPSVDYSHGLKPIADALRECRALLEQQRNLIERAHQRAKERELRRDAEREEQP